MGFPMTLQVLLKYFSKLMGKNTMPLLGAGSTAPAFELTTATGEKLSLKQALTRGPVLLAFFKINCPTCQYTFPFLERLYGQFREHGAQTWGIVQGSSHDGAQFAATYSITFPILVDNSPYKVSSAYRLSHVPSLFLVRPDGSIEISGEGFSKADLVAMHRSLAQALSATPPPLFLPNEKVPEFKPG